MLSIIQYFNTVCVEKFEKEMNSLYENPMVFDEFIANVESVTKELGRLVIKEALEEMDDAIRGSRKRKLNWVVEDKDEKQLLTSLGNVQYTKTLYAHKRNVTEEGKQEMCYLLDKVMGFTKNQRMTDEVKAKMYQEAVQTSYRRSGEVVGEENVVSKAAIKELLHGTKFPPNYHEQVEKKNVRYLYIDADEDHFHLQFQKQKGDLVVGKNNRKNNGAITKLIYVYEGIAPESPGSKRNKLINAHFFCRGTKQNNKALWQEVYDYMNATYCMERVEKIYINADGGQWIKEGMQSISGTKYVLDEFHLRKYVTKMCAHMMDTREDALREVYKTIRDRTKADFYDVVDRLKWCADSDVELAQIENSFKYIVSNWSAAKARINRKEEGIIGSSTEGHVYHVLAKRMSTNPMGWSRHGGEQMGRLLEYSFNGGDMLELAKYQKTELPKAAGAEEISCEVSQLMREREKIDTSFRKESGKYYEAMSNTLSLQKKKQMYFYVNHWLK